jgi:hypothetical protein
MMRTDNHPKVKCFSASCQNRRAWQPYELAQVQRHASRVSHAFIKEVQSCSRPNISYARSSEFIPVGYTVVCTLCA